MLKIKQNKKARREDAKLILTMTLEDDKTEITRNVHDQRTDEWWTDEQIEARGIRKFQNLEDAIETANWNLNGDTEKCQVSYLLPTVAELWIYE